MCLLVQVLVQAENLTWSPEQWFFLITFLSPGNCAHLTSLYLSTALEPAFPVLHASLCFLFLKVILFLVSVAFPWTSDQISVSSSGVLLSLLSQKTHPVPLI